MIERTRKPDAETAEPDTQPEGPFDLIEVRDIDINFGPGDSVSFTLSPVDVFEVTPATFRIFLAGNNERVEITRRGPRPVRWWSVRTHKVTMHRSLDPADTLPQ